MAIKNKKTSSPRSKRIIATERTYESDGTYLLKLVVVVLLGTLWLRFAQPLVWHGLPLNGLPLGLLIGLLIVHQFEKHQSDRKIWYACLIVVTIVCYFFPTGIFI